MSQLESNVPATEACKKQLRRGKVRASRGDCMDGEAYWMTQILGAHAKLNEKGQELAEFEQSWLRQLDDMPKNWR